MSDTPRTDAACAPQSSAYLMFQEVVRVSRELERENEELYDALHAILEGMEASGGWAGDDALFDMGMQVIHRKAEGK